MNRPAILLVVATAFSPSLAGARGFWIKLDLNGSDYTLALDRVPKKAKPVAGYSALYSVGSYSFRPVSGTGFPIADSRVVLGLTEYGNATMANGFPCSF